MSKAISRVQNIKKKIEFINDMILEAGGIVQALEDEKKYRAAILMHLTSIAEQFDKLSKDGEFSILENFDKRDIKGSYDVRNFIAHDYDGVNLSVIEDTIRKRLPIIKSVTDKIISTIS
jgi:uncharacterized protein with HEPN domain